MVERFFRRFLELQKVRRTPEAQRKQNQVNGEERGSFLKLIKNID